MKKYLLPENGNFYKSNLHCHSTISDGAFTPQELKEIYKSKGYQILSITDHNIIVDHSYLNEEDFLLLTGAEYNVNEPGWAERRFWVKTYHLNFIAKRPDNKAMESALLAGDLLKVAHNLCNVFDPVVTADHLELNYIKSIFNSYGAAAFQMTGSGSAVFAIVSEFEIAAVICDMLRQNYPRIFIAKPV